MKLKYDKLLIGFAFKCNLRHFIMAKVYEDALSKCGSMPAVRAACEADEELAEAFAQSMRVGPCVGAK